MKFLDIKVGMILERKWVDITDEGMPYLLVTSIIDKKKCRQFKGIRSAYSDQFFIPWDIKGEQYFGRNYSARNSKCFKEKV